MAGFFPIIISSYGDNLTKSENRTQGLKSQDVFPSAVWSFLPGNLWNKYAGGSGINVIIKLRKSSLKDFGSARRYQRGVVEFFYLITILKMGVLPDSQAFQKFSFRHNTFFLTFKVRFLYSRNPKKLWVGGRNVDNFKNPVFPLRENRVKFMTLFSHKFKTGFLA